MQIMMTLNTSATQNSSNINLQNEVSKLKFELHQLEQHHSDFVKEYDQLSAYTGELQEKLRKTRLNVKD
jgi:predicted  nucleic acid-binding Zn-ribbon protein